MISLSGPHCILRDFLIHSDGLQSYQDLIDIKTQPLLTLVCNIVFFHPFGSKYIRVLGDHTAQSKEMILAIDELSKY